MNRVTLALLVVAARAAAEDAPLLVSGDFRLRPESSLAFDGEAARQRERVRLRIAISRALGEATLGARLTTGGTTERSSPHVTLGGGLRYFPVSLDQAFLGWRPRWGRGVRVVAGKFAHPFETSPVYGQLAWDQDVQPEGAALSFVRQRPGRLAGLTATLGGYVLAERARAGDARAWALQVGSRWRLGDGEQLRAVVGYLGVGERQSAALIGDNAGNATLDRDGDGRADAFRSAYGVLRPFVAFEGEGRIPVTLTVEGFWNARARSAARSGWLLGAALGHASRPGRVRLEYQRHALEQDAIFTPVAADDFLRRTAQRGHYLGAQYRVSRRFDLHLTGFAAKPLAGDRATAWRWRLDLNASY